MFLVYLHTVYVDMEFISGAHNKKQFNKSVATVNTVNAN